MKNSIRIFERVIIIIVMIWLAINTLLTGPPGQVNCELCEDLNYQLRILYLPYFLTMFLLTGILVWYLVKPNKALRIISILIVLLTVFLTIYMISNQNDSFWGIIFDFLNDSYLNS